MNETVTNTLRERGARYGEFENHAAIAQAMKSACKAQGTSWSRMEAPQREALEMILHKVARIVNGDPDYADSWQDIAGYATLVVQYLESGTPRPTLPEAK